MCDSSVLFHSEFLPLHCICHVAIILLSFLFFLLFVFFLCLFVHVFSYAFLFCVVQQIISIFIYHLQCWLSPWHLKRSSSCRTTKPYTTYKQISKKKDLRTFPLIYQLISIAFPNNCIPTEWMRVSSSTTGSAHRKKYRRGKLLFVVTLDQGSANKSSTKSH